MPGSMMRLRALVEKVPDADILREPYMIPYRASEAEPFRTAFLSKLTRRGLCGVKLIISHAHEGIKAAVSKLLGANGQRCGVHFMLNALARAGKSGQCVVTAFITNAFAQ